MNLWLTYSGALFDKEKGTDFFLFKAIFFQTAFVNVESKFSCDLNKYSNLDFRCEYSEVFTTKWIVIQN